MAERRSRTAVPDPDDMAGGTTKPADESPAPEEVILTTNASPELVAQHEEKPASMQIERSDERSWWCPYDGHSNLWTLQTCGGCGAERDDMTVRKRQ